MVKRVTELPLREYLANDWNDWNESFKPYLKRAVLEMMCVYATGEATRDGRPFTPLYWNKISEGKWLYSLWELK